MAAAIRTEKSVVKTMVNLVLLGQPLKTTFELINEFIIALSHLLWPLLGFFVVILFRKEVRALLLKLKKLKIFGQEIELNDEIDQLQKTTEIIESNIPKDISHTSNDEQQYFIADIKNPKISLLKLSNLIELHIKNIFASVGLLNSHTYFNVLQGYKLIVKQGYLNENLIPGITMFWDLRNKIVHSTEEIADDQVIRVLDTGIVLLNTLKSIPLEKNIVYHPGVDIYYDMECTQLIEGVKGLMLETTSPGGLENIFRIFPTTRLDYYQKGMYVAWEWNFSKVFPAAWYIDPISNEKKGAWFSSMEFIGRDFKTF